MTKKQRELLNFIHNFIEENGFFPQLRDIAEGMGNAVSVVHGKFRRLVDSGYIKQVSPKKFILNEVKEK